MVDLRYVVPAEDVRDLVSVYYYFESDGEEYSDSERAAIAQVRFILQGTGQMDFANETSVECEGAVLVGPTTGAMHFTAKGPFRMFGCGLMPAGWGSSTKALASDYADTAVPAEQVLGSVINDRFKDVFDCDDVDMMVALSDAAFRRLKSRMDPQVLDFAKMVDAWLASEVSPPVSGLMDRAKLSSRQVLRLTNKLYGMPPKFLARKYRALRAARALAESDEAELDQLLDAFYDQSHMIREIKYFAGTTPKKLRVGEGEVATLIDKRGDLDGEITPLTSRT